MIDDELSTAVDNRPKLKGEILINLAELSGKFAEEGILVDLVDEEPIFVL